MLVWRVQRRNLDYTTLGMIFEMAVVRVLVLLQAISLVLCGVTIDIKLVHYDNPTSREHDGDCCDVFFGPCGINRCDNRFEICLDHRDSSTSFTVCPIGSIDTDRIYDGNDNFDFPSAIPGGISNPITKTHSEWRGGIRFKVKVYDYDPSNNDDLVDRYDQNMNFDPIGFADSGSNSWREYRLSGLRSTMDIEIRARCQDNYYGNSCSTYCIARDNAQGHYTCKPDSGVKVCNDGWSGPGCDQDINECESTPCMNGGTCEHGENYYVCTCTTGWGGSLCHLLVNICITSPCANNATCTPYALEDGSSNYTCNCTSGWEGQDCSDEIYECKSSPCLNGGICQDRLDNWLCICKDGWTGRSCDEALEKTTQYQSTENQHTQNQNTQNQNTQNQNTEIQYTHNQHTQNQYTQNQHTQKQHTQKGNNQQQQSSDESNTSLLYLIILGGFVFFILIILLILFIRRRRKEPDVIVVDTYAISQEPTYVMFPPSQLGQATGGNMYDNALPAKTIPNEDDELESFQNPVYMLTLGDIQNQKQKEENIYEECKENGAEDENAYVHMNPTIASEPNLYFVD